MDIVGTSRGVHTYIYISVETILLYLKEYIFNYSNNLHLNVNWYMIPLGYGQVFLKLNKYASFRY